MVFGSDAPANGAGSVESKALRGRRVDNVASKLARAVAAQQNVGQQPTSSSRSCCQKCGIVQGPEDRWPAPGFCTACVQKLCGVCKNPITKQQSSIRCLSCHCFIHVHCDSSASLQTQYTCPPCQRTRIAMAQQQQQQQQLNPQQLAQLVRSVDPTSFATAFPPQQLLQHLMHFNKPSASPQSSSDFDDSSQNVSRSAMSSPTTITTTASGSASPALANGDSLDGEEFRMTPRRGEGASRGARAGKKKPGVGRPAKNRSGGKPASTIAYLAEKGPPGKGPAGKGGKARGRSQKGKGKAPKARKYRAEPRAALRADEGAENEDPKIRTVDENDYVRTAIVTSALDTYVKEAPLCLVCGSIGKDVEGTMLACSSCAQSYHTYCVGMHDKMSTTILKRGWRCLDCTICEGCGDGKDESKLLLCDECDMAFHTYCLDPPLTAIPQGSWRCKWCTTCTRCQSRVPSAFDLQHNEGFCGPCYSQRKCPKCKKLYENGDLMIRCQHCSRWLHGRCEDLTTEEMLENAAENAYRCSLCRPKSQDPSTTMLIDNVLLTKAALEEMSQRHGNHFLRSTSSMSLGAVIDPFHRVPQPGFDNDGFVDDGALEDRCDSDFVVARGRGRGGMRGTRMPRLGVGGFIVKQPRHRMLATMSLEEEEAEGELQANGKPKVKRPRKPRRPPLEECYPPQVQESFFGMQPVDSRTLEAVDEPMLDIYLKTGLDAQMEKTGCVLRGEVAEQLANEDMMIDDAELAGLDMDMDVEDFNLLMDDDDEALNQMLGDNDDLADALDIAQSDPLFEAARQPQPLIDQHHQVTAGMPVSFHNAHVPPHMQQMQRPQPPPQRPPQKAKPDIEKGNQATERWQDDEPLGDKATKAAVLYANITRPNLRQEFPEWSERQKQITRMWRALDQAERIKYVAKARENRTNNTKKARLMKKATECPSTSAVPRPVAPVSMAPQLQMAAMRQQQIKMEHPAQMTLPPKQAFKVPTVPQTPIDHGPATSFPVPPQMRPMQPQFVPQSPVPQHPPQMLLPPQVIEQYELMRKRTLDLERQQMSIENELLRMRKAKKNLTAKRRQLQKSADGAAELNEADLQQLGSLAEAIPERQRALEECRKDLRAHQATVLEFEAKYGIQGVMRPTSTAPSPHRQSPAVKMELLEFSEPPTPSSGRPGSSASFDFQNQPAKRGRKRKVKTEEPASQPMPTLGGYSLEMMRSDEEIGAYFVLLDVVNRATRMVDGSEHEDGIRQILQQATQGRPPPPQAFPQNQLQMPMLGEPPKAKKKRAQPLKKPLVEADDYTLFVQRVDTQLQMCLPIAHYLQNPSSTRWKGDQYMLRDMGLSTLPEKGPQTAVIGNEFGEVRLNFVRDYFDDLEHRRHRDAPGPVAYSNPSTQPPPMATICQEVNLANLSHYPGSHQAPAVYFDAAGPADPFSEAGFELLGLRLWSGAGRLSPVVRARHRFVDRPYAMASIREPGRQAMLDSEREKEEETLSVGITFANGVDVSKVVGCLREILGADVVPDIVPFESPPMSPSARTNSVVPEQPAMNGIVEEMRSLICRQCSSAMRDAAIQQSLNQMGIIPSESPSDDKENTVSFCSMQCYYTFVADRKIALTPEQVQDAEQYVDKPTLVKLQQVAAENFARCLNQGKLRVSDLPMGPRIVCPPSALSSSGVNSPTTSEGPPLLGGVANAREMTIRVADIPTLLGDVRHTPEAAPEPRKVWRGRGWTVCDMQLLESFTKAREQAKCLCIVDQIRANERNKIKVEADLRQCVLCGDVGDGELDVCGRLLNFDADKWVHVNCALWSPEVAEVNGALRNVEDAVRRGQTVACRLCGRLGATLMCAKQDCHLLRGGFHLKCAKQARGCFVRDKTFQCDLHVVREDQQVFQLRALRRIYVDKDENQLISKLFHSNAASNSSTGALLMRVGSLIFTKIGQLQPDQLKNFHTSTNIFPAGYTVSRLFWSPDSLDYRVRYDCTIVDSGNQPQFQVSFGGKVNRDVSATKAWMPVLMAVKRIRDEHGEVLKMFPTQMSGETLFGLNEPAISKLTESLPGAEQLPSYNFKHVDPLNGPLMDLPLALNPSGCARCEPLTRNFQKQKKTRWQITPQKSRPSQHFASSTASSSSACVDLLSSRETRARHASSVGAILRSCDPGMVRKLRANGLSDESIAMAMGGGPSTTSATFSQYKKMTKEWRNNVYLARSKIQGLGLYAKRDIEMSTMIIEYIGEQIRSEVGEIREKRYLAQNRGVYMFRIDESSLIDATMTGGLARYINHSCDPNCSTKVVTVCDEKHIIIYANRPIKADEELTYDYLFEEEDEKIACLCGAPNCTKFMN
uniref:Histone-lysine N-methyltransferase n=1 Tax=Steinernema glaseri TaxID=37863 RepID=A0A1I8ARR7_9BILA